jgi:uncharacterized protein with beta-barrel porin domain
LSSTWIGYSQSSFSVDSRNSTGTTSSYDVGLYGGNQWGNLGLRFGAAYGWNNITTSRSVAFTGYTDSLGPAIRPAPPRSSAIWATASMPGRSASSPSLASPM